MRIIVFFDLPVGNYNEIKAYTQFRKFLINEGFIMMQESVYTKLALNLSVVNAQVQRLKNSKPEKGLVEILTITEKQFSSIEYVVGDKRIDVIDTEARLVII